MPDDSAKLPPDHSDLASYMLALARWARGDSAVDRDQSKPRS